jgi:hypothetical protein
MRGMRLAFQRFRSGFEKARAKEEAKSGLDSLLQFVGRSVREGGAERSVKSGAVAGAVEQAEDGSEPGIIEPDRGVEEGGGTMVSECFELGAGAHRGQ